MLRSDPISYGFMLKIPRHGWAVMVTRLIQRRPHISIRSRVQVSCSHVLTCRLQFVRQHDLHWLLDKMPSVSVGMSIGLRGADQKSNYLIHTNYYQHFCRLKATRLSIMARLIITLSGIQMPIIITRRVKQTSRTWWAVSHSSGRFKPKEGRIILVNFLLSERLIRLA